jgi:hypothetical protein
MQDLSILVSLPHFIPISKEVIITNIQTAAGSGRRKEVVVQNRERLLNAGVLAEWRQVIVRWILSGVEKVYCPLSGVEKGYCPLDPLQSRKDTDCWILSGIE